MNTSEQEEQLQDSAVAIIGMSGRFPMARDLDEFWQNLVNGIEAISHFSQEELLAAGTAPELLADPHYVRAKGLLEDIDLFDAAFFGYSPREAELIDPQQRLFLECAWHALENAGYDPFRYEKLISVYAGQNLNIYHSYLLMTFLQDPALRETVDTFQLVLANDKDYLTTRASYKLNLRGPSIDVQTACSTSLVAVHLACQSLLNGECDMALAGGVSLHDLQKSGYYYREGSVASPDGHCRTFDAQAQGTLSGSGLGVVVLKRLADALQDGDYIHAVIRGTACNNDGATKVGFTAPSIQGQAQVIAEAQAMAGIASETISYIEAHGTATPVGDPIEVAALTLAFDAQCERKQFCALGSVKTNIGHLGPAAGIAGLLKTVLALKHQILPPSLHFEVPNPQIDFVNSPFYVNTASAVWKGGDSPRRAGVSSFGIGGTNAHVIVEEAPPLKQSVPSTRPWSLLVLSGKSEAALQQIRKDLGTYLRDHPDLNLADVAYTLQVGRGWFSHRHILLCQHVSDAAQGLIEADPVRLLYQVEGATERPVAFLFPGQGSQYIRMGAELYQVESRFREEVDRCARLLLPWLDRDIRTILFPQGNETSAEAISRINQTWLTQPALFVIEYALAQLWMSWGIEPWAMIGHSIGEYVAACLAGVFTLEDALRIVAIRGRLVQQIERGAMVAVSCSRTAIQRFLSTLPAKLADQLSIAANNAPTQVVVSGPVKAIDELAQQLRRHNMESKLLHTSHAFHSSMIDSILVEFAAQISTLPLKAPTLRYISNLTGTWITAAEALDPQYWVNHLRQEVRFAEGIATLLQEPELAFLEVGPGRTLISFAQQQVSPGVYRAMVPSLPGPTEKRELSDTQCIMSAIGRLWLSGVQLDWQKFHAAQARQRLPLPGYPFVRQRYWIERSQQGVEASMIPFKRKADIAEWFYLPAWKQVALPDLLASQRILAEKSALWLIFLDERDVGIHLTSRLRALGQKVVTVSTGLVYRKLEHDHYQLRPQQRDDYVALLADIRDSYGTLPEKLLHLWNMGTDVASAPETALRTFDSLILLAQALGEQEHGKQAIFLGVLSQQLQAVIGTEEVVPEQALALGPCKVIPLEYAGVTCRSIDLSLPDVSGKLYQQYLDQIIAECVLPATTPVVAYRGSKRWEQVFEPVPFAASLGESPLLRRGGVYLIVGGLGGIGLTCAEALAKTVGAKLILTGRTALPERAMWDAWLASHDQDDSISRKLRKLAELEEAGSELLIRNVDVTDEWGMQQLIADGVGRFGGLHGVMHAAGIASGGLAQLKTLDMAHTVLASKVTGIRVLERLLNRYELDVFVLCSSQSSIQGGTGQIDYSAANAFLDAFAPYYQTRYGTPTIAINWDTWQEVGMAVNTPLPADLWAQRQRALKDAIHPNEGLEAFKRILSRPHPQVIVSTTNFLPTIRRAELARSAEENGQPAAAIQPIQAVHPRPALATLYVAPRNDIERKIAQIWSLLLGIEQIGVHDSFFELGGHSLLATQVISRLRSDLRVDLPLRRLLEKPTIAELAAALEQSSQTQSEHTQFTIVPAVRRTPEQLLENLDTLSDEDVEALLRRVLEEE